VVTGMRAVGAVSASMWHGSEWESGPAVGPWVGLLVSVVGTVGLALMGAASEEWVVVSLVFEAGDPVPEGGGLLVVGEVVRHDCFFCGN